MPKKNEIVIVDPIQHFWNKVNERGEDECWEWQGYKNQDGYGRIAVGKRVWGTCVAHRVCYIITTGQIPARIEVCHTCDNPPCCNPKHLFLGTHADNMLDMKIKGRLIPPPILLGEEKSWAKITTEQALDIRETYLKSSNKATALLLSNKYGVKPSHIRDIAKGRKWKHLTPAYLATRVPDETEEPTP